MYICVSPWRLLGKLRWRKRTTLFFLRGEIFTLRFFYAETFFIVFYTTKCLRTKNKITNNFLPWGPFVHRCFCLYTQKNTQRIFHTQTRLHTDFFAQRCFYPHLLTIFLQTFFFPLLFFTHGIVYTSHVYTEVSYTQTFFFRTDVFTQRIFSHRVFTHNNFTHEFFLTHTWVLHACFFCANTSTHFFSQGPFFTANRLRLRAFKILQREIAT